MTAHTPKSSSGDHLVDAVPEGDTLPRKVCPDCGYIKYENPKIVAGAVCLWNEGGEAAGTEKILLCRRAIEPRIGFWTIPAGYLELGETTAEGAARETWEEACARVAIEGLIGVYEIPHISQIYVIHRARLGSLDFAPGAESQEVALFGWEDIPWAELAFPSVTWALNRHGERYGKDMAPVHHVAPPGTLK